MQETLQHSTISAIVLAAGMSARMGTLKQLLRMGDKSLLETVIENLRKSQADEIVLLLGFSAETIRQQVSLDGVRAVVNEAYREGMGSSLRAGLANVDPRAEAALIVLADQPFVQPGTIDHLINQYRERKPQIAIPVYEGFRGNPVLLDRSVFPEVMSLTGDIGCRAIFGSHSEDILKVPVDDVGVLLDVDTRSDFEKLEQAYERGDLQFTLLESADLEGRKVGGEPPVERPQLVVVGQEAVARALVKIGRLLNFTITVVDPFLAISELPEADHILHALDFSRLPRTAEKYVVVASRGRFDEEAIEQALDAGAAYIALVSNRKRVQEILAGLKARSISPEKLARVHAPAGLNIGAESPEEIALSVMAEIVSERRGKR
jgi:CTP:molybdopterin cytidylyltransferase MocA